MSKKIILYILIIISMLIFCQVCCFGVLLDRPDYDTDVKVFYDEFYIANDSNHLQEILLKRSKECNLFTYHQVSGKTIPELVVLDFDETGGKYKQIYRLDLDTTFKDGWWEGTCQHVAHDEWIEIYVYKDGTEKVIGGKNTFFEAPLSTYDKDNHKMGDWVEVKRVDATSTKEGYVVLERYCTRGKGWWGHLEPCVIKETKTEPLKYSVPAQYTLDYDELSKEFVHKIEGSKGITGNLLQPYNFYKWADGSSTFGSLDITLDKAAGKVAFPKNPIKNNTSSSTDTRMTLYPTVDFTLRRDLLGDNPNLVKGYHKNGMTSMKSFDIEYNGSLERPYKHLVDAGHNSTCPPDCSKSHRYVSNEILTASNLFDSGYDTISVQAKVYNGVEIPVKNVEKKQESKKENGTWKWDWQWSNNFNINVKRFMKEVKADGTENKVVVPGQFDRTFVGTNKAKIELSIPESFYSHFYTDINNGKNSRTNGSKSMLYPNVPCATDKSLKKYYTTYNKFPMFPMKSGYYCDPGAEYKVKVYTEVYKKGKGGSQEHKELVDALKNSFRFESNMQYINPQKKVYSIGMDLVNNKSAIKDYPDDELVYADNDSIDERLKSVMEGWKDSNTISSYDTYKYKEYVDKNADGSILDLHRVVEETTITFKISTPKRIYTNHAMKDGEYFFKSWFNDFSFKGFNFDISNQNNPLDAIYVAIRGSYYDDMNVSD